MFKKDLISDEERELFRTSIGDARPLKKSLSVNPNRPKPLNKKTPLIKILKREEAEAQLRDDLCTFADDERVAALQSDESLMYAVSGLQHRTLVELQHGKIPSQATLDLHGLTSEEAHLSLHRFLSRVYAKQLRCVRIIHGKGARHINEPPVLKNKVNQWLRRYDKVLAFCSATPAEGGQGAVYVLLRRESLR